MRKTRLSGDSRQVISKEHLTEHTSWHTLCQCRLAQYEAIGRFKTSYIQDHLKEHTSWHTLCQCRQLPAHQPLLTLTAVHPACFRLNRYKPKPKPVPGASARLTACTHIVTHRLLTVKSFLRRALAQRHVDMTLSAADDVLSRHVAAAAAGSFFDLDDCNALPGGGASFSGNTSSKHPGFGAETKDLRQWSFGSHRASEESLAAGRPNPPPLRRSHSTSDLFAAPVAAPADHGSLYITDPGSQRRRASATERLLSELSTVRPQREQRDSVMSTAVASRELRERDDCMYLARDGSKIVAKARI